MDIPPPTSGTRHLAPVGAQPAVRGHAPGHSQLLRHTAIGLLIWLVACVALSFRPTLNLADLRGAYAVEGTARPFRWTSDQVLIPLDSRSGPTYVELDIGRARWAGRADQQVALATDTMSLATIVAPDTVRHYRLLLPPATRWLRLTTTLHQSPQGDPRWLGVQLFGLRATPSGLPLRAARDGLLLALALVALRVGLAWGRPRGLRALVFTTALALGLRLALLDRLPPGFTADEAVSVVDAWYLVHTARDHLGHLLPLGAFEAFGDWIAPLLTYLELPFVALLGPVALAGRLTTALVGALAVPAGYALARALGLPRTAATLAALAIALSPWQIFLSRVAIPPALVPLSLTLCLWAGVCFLRRGDRIAALGLALAGGVALYAYPTLKLLVPLLVALATALALRRHGRAALRRWWPAALLIALIWLPFVYTTLFNPASNMRLSRKALHAATLATWVTAWSRNYTAYLRPDFYYTVGDPGLQFPEGVELAVEAPLVLLGLGMLVWRCALVPRASTVEIDAEPRVPPEVWWFIAGAALLAALPASLTSPNPHLLRGATVAPVYALLIGMGGAGVGAVTLRLRQTALRRGIQAALTIAVAAALLWQSGQWVTHYVRDYPRYLAHAYQDGLFEAFQRAVALAPQFDEIWVGGAMNQAPIYLLAAQPLPPAEDQAQIVARRAINRFTLIRQIGRYHFNPPELNEVPRNLPALTLVLDQVGESGFVLQAWQSEQRRVLIVRRMH